MIGYLIEQELGNLLPLDKPLATVLTMTEVDPADPAFGNPTKFVGPVYAAGRRPAARRSSAAGSSGQDGDGVAAGRPLAASRGGSSRSGRSSGCWPAAAWSSAPAAAASRPCTRPAPARWSASRRSSTRTAPAPSSPADLHADLLVIATDVDARLPRLGHAQAARGSLAAPRRARPGAVPGRLDGPEGRGGRPVRPRAPGARRSSARWSSCPRCSPATAGPGSRSQAEGMETR